VARRKVIKTSTMSIDELSYMPGMLDVRMYDIKDNLWRPHEKRLVTGNPVSAEAWQDKLRAQGFIDQEELREEQGRMHAIIRAARKGAGEGTYDEASIANKTSGYGLKPSRRPTRDYQAPASVRNNGNPTGVVRLGKGWTS
jgi:hypothetical protein